MPLRALSAEDACKILDIPTSASFEEVVQAKNRKLAAADGSMDKAGSGPLAKAPSCDAERYGMRSASCSAIALWVFGRSSLTSCIASLGRQGC